MSSRLNQQEKENVVKYLEQQKSRPYKKNQDQDY